MDKILEGQVLINGIDIWKTYGVFLTEEKQGGRENLNAILTPSKTKDHIGVDFREAHGKKYSNALLPADEERDVTLRAFYVESSSYRALTYLWKEGVQASRYKVKFREPDPIV